MATSKKPAAPKKDTEPVKAAPKPEAASNDPKTVPSNGAGATEPKETGRTTGRPSKLTPQVTQQIVQALQAGNYQDVAASYAGISKGTFYSWMDRGRIERDRQGSGLDPDETEAPFLEFLNAIETARAQSEVRAVALINKAAQGGTWQAAAWFLERSYPNRWSRYQRNEVTGPQGGPIQHVVGEDSLLAALDRFLKDDEPDGRPA